MAAAHFAGATRAHIALLVTVARTALAALAVVVMEACAVVNPVDVIACQPDASTTQVDTCRRI